MKKETQLRSLLAQIQSRPGSKPLRILNDMSIAHAEKFLMSLPGVGLKTARCVLMFSLGRKVFPVDTHVNRVMTRLGLVRPQRLTENSQNIIQRAVPPNLRHNLHVNLIMHGRKVCTSRNPACESCFLSDLCKFFQSVNA